MKEIQGRDTGRFPKEFSHGQLTSTRDVILSFAAEYPTDHGMATVGFLGMEAVKDIPGSQVEVGRSPHELRASDFKDASIVYEEIKTSSNVIAAGELGFIDPTIVESVGTEIEQRKVELTKSELEEH